MFLGTRPGSLVRIHARGALGLGRAGRRGASGFCDFEPGAFLNLYRIAHSESTVDKWNNSTSLPSAGARRDETCGKKYWCLVKGQWPPQLGPMLTLRGVASIAELIAAACLVIALAGFAKWRVASWLVCGAAAALALVVAALVVIGQS